MTSGAIRVVLDTNVLVSALLFERGCLSWLRLCWQSGQLTPVLAKPTAQELLRVLAYPKFKLEPADRDRLLQDLLPWCESWSGPIASTAPRVRDRHDQVFLNLALAAATPVLVSGDADLLALQGEITSLQILSPASFHDWLRPSQRLEPGEL